MADDDATPDPQTDEAVAEDRENTESQPDQGVTRRNLFKISAAAGVSATALAAGSGGRALAQDVAPGESESGWDYEADVVVIGGGCTGLPAAIRALDLGASVLVVEQNFDLGGRMLHSGSWVSLGGGDPVQERDLAGESDPEGYITVGRQVDAQALEDNIDLLFRDVTDWSILDKQAYPYYRYNDPDQHRGWAENCPATRQFLMENYVRFARINGTHFGGGMSRARAASCFLKLGSVTDIKNGTVTPEDAGVADDERSSHFAPRQQSFSADRVDPDAVHGGACMSRALEYSAREKGVRFMLNRHLDEVIRENPSSGRVLGVRASYTPRFDPDTGERLESLWHEGNIDERQETITIRARKAVVMGSGGHAGNPNVRSMFYPRMNEPYYPTSGWALLGEGRAQDGTAISEGMRIGASLDGLHQNFGRRTYHIQTRLGVRDAYTDMYPGHPTFKFRRSAGFDIGQSGFENIVAVNQVGKRFFNEMLLPEEPLDPRWPVDGSYVPAEGQEAHTPYDWRNCSTEWVRQMYQFSGGVDAALQINEGSQAPHYYAGPIWAIFDQAAVDRADLPIREPFVADNGQFFQADTLEELAEKIFAGNEYQRMRLSYLADTIAQWNRYVDNGEDPDFERGRSDAPMHKVNQPPYYAASIMVVWHDSYGGMRINRNAQVLDMTGEPIPGLYAGGEASGGGQMHGLGRAAAHGYIAGTTAVREPVVGTTR